MNFSHYHLEDENGRYVDEFTGLQVASKGFTLEEGIDNISEAIISCSAGCRVELQGPTFHMSKTHEK